MPRIRVVLVGPKIEGNVGAVARVMGNFGFQELYLVDPCPMGDEARRRAKHAGEVLENAAVVDSLEEAVTGASLVVGTTGIASPGEKHFIRIPITPRSLAERLEDHPGSVVLLFGREDLGLSQEELGRCDLLVHIPAGREYPVLNLSHAVAIVLYELALIGADSGGPTETSEVEREKLLEFFSRLLEAIDYPEFRREKTEIMFRRMMGRAVPTKWEFYTIMGVMADAVRLIEDQRS